MFEVANSCELLRVPWVLGTLVNKSDIVNKHPLGCKCAGEKLDQQLNFGYTPTLKLEHDLRISRDLSLLMVLRLLRQPGCPFKLSIWLTVCILSYRAWASATVLPTFIMFRYVYCNVFFWNQSREACGDCSWYRMQCLTSCHKRVFKRVWLWLTGTQRESIPREAYLSHCRKDRAEDDFLSHLKLSKAL